MLHVVLTQGVFWALAFALVYWIGEPLPKDVVDGPLEGTEKYRNVRFVGNC